MRRPPTPTLLPYTTLFRSNARATVALRDQEGLEALVLSFAPDDPPSPHTTEEMQTTSSESVALSKALKKRGFAFRSEDTRLNSSHMSISYAVFCLKKKRKP